jgi:SAM-dependent methyltransferase
MEEYEEAYHSSLHNFLYKDSNYYRARAKLAVKRYFQDIPVRSQIFEFGCGLGQNILLLQNAIGYDISKFSLKFCESKGIKVTTDLNKLKNNSFDIAFSCHVLEHLENPFETIQDMKTKLKEGGKLILILPVEGEKRSNFEMEESQHIYSWNFQNINNLLIKAGFKIQENEYIYSSGHKKLLFLSKIDTNLYDLATRFIGKIRNTKEMKIIATKI